MSESRPARHDAAPLATARATSNYLKIKRVGGCVFAVVLSWLAATLSFHTPALRGNRLALNFCAVAATATLFGMGPALVAIAVSVVAFEHYLPAPTSPEPILYSLLIRSAVICAATRFVVLLLKQRHAAERDLRETLAALQEQTDALMQAQQAGHSAVWTFNAQTRETRWYAGAVQIFGYAFDDVITLGSLTSFVFEEDRKSTEAVIEDAIRTGGPLLVEFRVVWPNGEVHWLETRGVPLASNPDLWRGTTIDITVRKQAEETLIRTEKLAVAGRLAASIAHEAVINLCYLARVTAVSEETRGYIELAEAELGRVAHITSQTLRFHRQQSAAAETDLGETLRSILALYEGRLAQAGITVEFDAAPTRPLVCYAGEMRQVLANLVANAIDAMPTGGTLRLRVRESTDWRTGAAAVRITVADTGHGMSAETRKRIYEPFYTTKGDVGTGLGLWVPAGIVEKHNGSMSLRSSERPGCNGSAFTLVLPYVTGADVEAEALST
jgi:PAS domain S-box-containing protein